MYRGTTPVIPIRIKNVDLTNAKLFLTFCSKNGKLLTLTTPDDFTVSLDGEDTVGEVALTQEQTFSMVAVAHSVQIRWVTPDGTAGATVIRPFTVNDVLYKEVIRYE